MLLLLVECIDVLALTLAFLCFGILTRNLTTKLLSITHLVRFIVTFETINAAFLEGNRIEFFLVFILVFREIALLEQGWDR